MKVRGTEQFLVLDLFADDTVLAQNERMLQGIVDG